MTAETTPPSGTVAFLFSDVVGSTRLWARDSEAMSSALEIHDELLRSCIEERRGYVFTTAGDAFCAAFASADDAIGAAGEIQDGVAQVSWPTADPLRVRIGLHAGAAVERGGDYFGPVLNTAARVEAAAQPGQILATAAVRVLSEVPLRSLGAHRLRDLAEPLEFFQVGAGDFGPVRSLEGVVSMLPVMANRLIGRGGEVAEVRRLLTRSRLVTITRVGGLRQDPAGH